MSSLCCLLLRKGPLAYLPANETSHTPVLLYEVAWLCSPNPGQAQTSVVSLTSPGLSDVEIGKLFTIVPPTLTFIATDNSPQTVTITYIGTRFLPKLFSLKMPVCSSKASFVLQIALFAQKVGWQQLPFMPEQSMPCRPHSKPANPRVSSHHIDILDKHYLLTRGAPACCGG